MVFLFRLSGRSDDYLLIHIRLVFIHVLCHEFTRNDTLVPFPGISTRGSIFHMSQGILINMRRSMGKLLLHDLDDRFHQQKIFWDVDLVGYAHSLCVIVSFLILSHSWGLRFCFVCFGGIFLLVWEILFFVVFCIFLGGGGLKFHNTSLETFCHNDCSIPTVKANDQRLFF